MTRWYTQGQQDALEKLGGLTMRESQSPFREIHRQLDQAFKINAPEMDVSKLLARLFKNPFSQPQKHISGQWPGLRV